MGVTNAEIRVEGPEIPIGDGSALGFVDAIQAIGVVAQNRPRSILTVDEPFVVEVADRMIALLPAPAFADPLPRRLSRSGWYAVFLRRDRRRQLPPRDRGSAHVRLPARSRGAYDRAVSRWAEHWRTRSSSHRTGRCSRYAGRTK